MKPVSKTAFYCCGVRMLDAHSNKPLINDHYAEKLLGQEGMQYWEKFKSLTIPNSSNIARCYLIDKHLAEILSADPERTVILVGAGLDSRAFRLPHGKWVEIDEPGVINYKNKVLPVVECSNSLQRISIDFEKEELDQKLIQFSNMNPIIIVEGVLMYLTNGQRAALFHTLTKTIGRHLLLCDLMTKRFFERIVRGNEMYTLLTDSGAHFKDMISRPADFILEFGYHQIDVKSNVITAIESGLISIPKFIIRILFRKFLMGYSVFLFEYEPR